MAALSSTVRWKWDVKNALKGVQNMERSMKRLTKSAGTMAAGVGSVFAVREIKNFAAEASKMAGQFEGVQRAFSQNFDGKMFEQIKAATKGTVNELELMRNAVNAEQLGLPMEHFAEMLAFAQLRATQTGQSVDQLVEKLVLGIGRESVLRLDDLGLSAKRVQEEFKKTGSFASGVSKIIAEEMAKAGESVSTFSEVQKEMTASFENIKLKFGKIINAAITPLIEKIHKITEAFEKLSPGTQNIIIAFSALAVAVPVVVVAIAAMTAAFGSLSAATLPITAAIVAFVAVLAGLVAVGFYVYDNWKAITERLTILFSKFVNGTIEALAKLLDGFGWVFQQLGLAAAPLGNVLRTFKKEIPNSSDATKFKDFGESMNNVMEELGLNTDLLTGKMDGFGKSTKKVTEKVKGLAKELKNLGSYIKDSNITGLVNFESNVGDESPIPEDFLSKEQIVIEKRMASMRQNAEIMNQAISDSVKNMAQNVGEGIGYFAGAIAAGTASMADFGKFVIQSFAGLLKQLGEVAIAIGVSIIAIKKSLTTLQGVGAIVAGIALIALSSFANSKISGMGKSMGGGGQSVPGFANGAIVTAPTLAVVGEGKESEAILPLSKLQTLMNNNNGQMIPDVKIDGNDLWLVFNRVNKRKNRIG